MQRNTPNNETITVEYGFLDSPKDDIEQIKKNYEKYAEAVVRAVADYKNIPYTAPQDSGYYTIQKGDSLWTIANKFGITVSKLKELNNLTSNTIKVGDTLKISTSEEEIVPEDYLIYKVKKGDSLWSIAKEYDTTVQTLMNINNLTSNSLTINQQILVPKTNQIEQSDMYTVKSGDTLYDIAKKYGITLDELKQENNLTSNIINIGDILKIPSQSTGEINYIVQSGDNLYSIANKYGTTVGQLMTINNLTNSNLQIGDTLLIPTN